MAKKTAIKTAVDELIEEDAAASPTLTPDMLTKIVGTCAEMRSLEVTIERGAKKMQELIAEHDRLRKDVLPVLMAEVGVKELRLIEGDTVKLEDEVYASIAKANAKDACKWLRKNKFGDLVKQSIIVNLGKGAETIATDVKKALRSIRVKFEELESVHAQTLKAFVKESIREGRELPTSISVHIQPVANLVRPKK